MSDQINYIAINKQSWNERVASHLSSEFYDVAGFLQGKTSLKEIELALLGDLKGKTVLHLQCHFGQDSISLARMGAKVTGVDLSDEAIERARELAAQTGEDATFVCCALYDLPQHLDTQFDIVFTSYGTIGWLPDLDRWANIVAQYLKPGGQFVFAEFHPVVWMFDDQFTKVGYDYFNSGPILETQEGTYADREADINLSYVNWNHGIAEVLTSLIGNKLSIDCFNEYDYAPYNCFFNTVEFEPGKFRIAHLEHKIPMVYALKATKPL
ncbi:SAM-dependent methyltransferase [Taibaiella sp. KBW10]|uniref:class I SAM-dependent methyltransferase n=1 Tax=Taibaiella sp. KBW10 TaxID=2153357 RepID=UPI000F5ACF06|nr:class I SAM-dependent methyltransferase [Taibaiella sp. KBW10]RQO31019.1 SAM-dependent methyltransferase [Taibaiella sp. KBW10]